jgi:hypothetical protein
MQEDLTSKSDNKSTSEEQTIRNKTDLVKDVLPQDTNKESCGCGNMSGTISTTAYSYVYAIGRIHYRFPNQSVEKEYAQVTGRTETKGLADPEVLHSVLSQKQNRYLVRQLCWVLTIEGIETYILIPRDPLNYDYLVEALRPVPRITDRDIVVIIGVKGPMADTAMCNGLILPIVKFDQIYSFDIDSLINSLTRPKNIPSKQFNAAVNDLFARIVLMADNAGATDEYRALNYLSVRYQAIYSHTAEMFSKDFSLSAIEVHPSPLSGVRKIVDVVFVYTNRNTDVDDKYSTAVDVTDMWPFLVRKLSPYYDR